MEINEIVEKAAEENKSQANENSGANQQQNNSGGGDGNGAGKSQEELDKEKAISDAETQRLADIEKVKTEATQAFLKELEVDSLEELKEKLAKTGAGALSAEDKKKAEEIYEAKLQQFAVEKELMGIDDFSQLKTLKSKEDAVLVFENYLKDWKEENPDVKVGEGVTEADIEKLAKDDFEKEFKLNSDKESVKAKGIQKLAKLAAEIRNPLESSYNNAKEEFDADTQLRTTFPKFVEANKKIASELVPETVEWFKGKDGEDEIPVNVPLPEADRAEILEKISKRLEKPEFFKMFTSGKGAEIKEIVSEYAEYLINKKTKDLGNAAIAEMFLNRGREKGSTTGANNSFATNQSQAGAHEQSQVSKTEKEKSVLEQFGQKK